MFRDSCRRMFLRWRKGWGGGRLLNLQYIYGLVEVFQCALSDNLIRFWDLDLEWLARKNLSVYRQSLCWRSGSFIKDVLLSVWRFKLSILLAAVFTSVIQHLWNHGTPAEGSFLPPVSHGASSSFETIDEKQKTGKSTKSWQTKTSTGLSHSARNEQLESFQGKGTTCVLSDYHFLVKYEFTASQKGICFERISFYLWRKGVQAMEPRSHQHDWFIQSYC